MNLWPPCSEIMEFFISSYRIVQLTSVKFCTLIKDDNRDILFSLSTLEFQYKSSHGHLEVKMRVFSRQMTYCSMTLVKRPARDACLCMGELPAPPAPAAPPAPHFVFLITL